MLDVKQLDLQYITNAAGEKTAVILPIQQFQQLLEDIQDLAAVAERRDEPTIENGEASPKRRRYSFIGIGRTRNPRASVEVEDILEREVDRQSGWSPKS